MKIQDHKHDRSKTQAEGSTWGNLTVPSAFLLGLERRSLWDFGLSNVENIDGTLENEETGQCRALESRSGKMYEPAMLPCQAPLQLGVSSVCHRHSPLRWVVRRALAEVERKSFQTSKSCVEEPSMRTDHGFMRLFV